MAENKSSALPPVSGRWRGLVGRGGGGGGLAAALCEANEERARSSERAPCAAQTQIGLALAQTRLHRQLKQS